MQAFALGRTVLLCVTYAVLLLDFLPAAGVALIDTAKLKITFGIDIDLPNLILTYPIYPNWVGPAGRLPNLAFRGVFFRLNTPSLQALKTPGPPGGRGPAGEGGPPSEQRFGPVYLL